MLIKIITDDTHVTHVRIQPDQNGYTFENLQILDPRFRGDDVRDYFNNPTHKFTLPLKPQGTDFQQRVWKALQDIPSGEVLTYGELAKKLNSHARAIGQACRRNPIPIIIPCHRVVGQQSLGGYSGDTDGDLMNFKKQLLKHEGVL